MDDLKGMGPFIFYTRLNLSELTGSKASSLEGLLALIKEVPGSCIYHHTHRFLQQHERLSPEPPNDFAYWISEALGERELAESVASIDIMQFKSIRSLRENIIATIEQYIVQNPGVADKRSKAGREFHFMKSISFVDSTNCEAHDLKEFADMLEKINVNSIYFHVFEARLRLDDKTNDFAYWIRNLGEHELADSIEKLDPYTYAVDDLRKAIIDLIRRKLGDRHAQNR
jgi:hypothetical protein